MKLCLFVLCAALAVAAAPDARGQSPIQLEPVLSGLTSPVYLTNAHDRTNRLFVVEQTGRVLVLQPGATTPTVFLDITARISSGGERGLLGLAFHPQYATNRRFFVNYTRAGTARRSSPSTAPRLPTRTSPTRPRLQSSPSASRSRITTAA